MDNVKGQGSTETLDERVNGNTAHVAEKKKSSNSFQPLDKQSKRCYNKGTKGEGVNRTS